MLISPIVDRTSDDVIYINNLKNKIKSVGLVGLTSDELLFWFNGGVQFLTDINDLFILTVDGLNLSVGDYVDVAITGNTNDGASFTVFGNSPYNYSVFQGYKLIG